MKILMVVSLNQGSAESREANGVDKNLKLISSSKSLEPKAFQTWS